MCEPVDRRPIMNTPLLTVIAPSPTSRSPSPPPPASSAATASTTAATGAAPSPRPAPSAGLDAAALLSEVVRRDPDRLGRRDLVRPAAPRARRADRGPLPRAASGPSCRSSSRWPGRSRPSTPRRRPSRRGLAEHLEALARDPPRPPREGGAGALPDAPLRPGRRSRPSRSSPSSASTRTSPLAPRRRPAPSPTDLVPPAEACTTWRALYLRLDELEAELMEHVHLENNVLFRRALCAEL